MLKRFITLFFAFICFLTVHAQSETAQSVFEKAVGKISGTSGLNTSFKINSPEGNISGSLKISGKKFRLDTSYGSTWYDGKNMWTSNKSSHQITLVNPTVSEITEVNPFAYIDSSKGKYKIAFSRRTESGRYLLLLNPKNSKENYKAVEIAVNKKTYLPERFIIRDKNDKITTVNINSLTLNGKYKDKEFICPVESMSDYEFVDLR